MKTKEQILDWLDRQPWKGEFYENVFKLGSADEISYDCCFISHAFPWCATQGGKVWVDRNTDFRSWYDSDKPMSWEEYCAQNPIKEGAYYLDGICQLQQTDPRRRNEIADANVMSKDLCEAFLAYMKLIQLRNAWVKGWDAEDCSIKIIAKDEDIFKDSYMQFMHGLSFPTSEMADEFMETFRDLLEVAKPLL